MESTVIDRHYHCPDDGCDLNKLYYDRSYFCGLCGKIYPATEIENEPQKFRPSS